MRASELRLKSVEELQQELKGLLQEQFSLRFQLKTGNLQSTNSIRVVRRNIARVQTVLAEMQKASA